MDNPRLPLTQEDIYETDDINFAGLLRALGVPQVGKRAEDTLDPERPRMWFIFSFRSRCLNLFEQLQLDDVQVGFNALSAEIVKVRNQVFQQPRRRPRPHR